MTEVKVAVVLAVVILYVFDLSTVQSSRPVRVRKPTHFRDYLISAGRRRLSSRRRVAPMSLNRLESDDEDMTGGWGSGGGPHNQRDPIDILHYLKEVPRSHWSCCILGRLAGDKGFQCHSQFYKSTRRNKSRAYNRRRLYGRSFAPRYSQGLMFTFSKCMASRTREFRKCCHAASTERRQMHRWHFYHEYRVSNPRN